MSIAEVIYTMNVMDVFLFVLLLNYTLYKSLFYTHSVTLAAKVKKKKKLNLYHRVRKKATT